jgi:hypothetical protein
MGTETRVGVAVTPHMLTVCILGLAMMSCDRYAFCLVVVRIVVSQAQHACSCESVLDCLG